MFCLNARGEIPEKFRPCVWGLAWRLEVCILLNKRWQTSQDPKDYIQWVLLYHGHGWTRQSHRQCGYAGMYLRGRHSHWMMYENMLLFISPLWPGVMESSQKSLLKTCIYSNLHSYPNPYRILNRVSLPGYHKSRNCWNYIWLCYFICCSHFTLISLFK